MKYQCPRCYYESDDRRNVKRHVNKKILCPDKSSTGIIPLENNIIELGNKKVICELCTGYFAGLKSLKVHITNCKGPTDKPIETKTIIIENPVDNPVINRIINDYENSTMTHISNEDIMALMKRCMMAIPYMIEKVHFDKRVPENHNICVSNQKEKKLVMKQNGSWASINADEMVPIIYKKYAKIFSDFSEDPNKLKQYPDLERIYENYKRITNNQEDQIYDDILIILYNNRQFCIDAKKQTE